MGTIVKQLIRVLSKKYEVIVLSVKVMRGEKGKVHYDIALNPKLRIIFNMGHIPTLILYELSGALWCLILRMLGVRNFLVQDAICSSFFATLIGKMTGARVYLFDYGPMLNVYNPDFVRMASSKYHRGSLTALYVKLMRLFTRVSLRHCYKFFVYSDEMRKHALNLGLKEERVAFYSFPVDTDVFRSYGRSERERIRMKLGFGENEDIVTFVGRISEDKGLPYLVESMKVLSSKYAGRLKFVVVGDGPLVEWFLENTKGDLGSRVLFLGPIYEPRRVADLLNASDIFVYPIIISAGYAMAFLEAMAVGLPGIITNVGPTKELIANEYNGIVIPTNDYKALTQSLERLIENEKLRKQIGENAKKVLTRFSIEAYKRTILGTIAG